MALLCPQACFSRCLWCLTGSFLFWAELVWEGRLLRKLRGALASGASPGSCCPAPQRHPSAGRGQLGPLPSVPSLVLIVMGTVTSFSGFGAARNEPRPARFHFNCQSHITEKKKKKAAMCYVPLFITFPPCLAVRLLSFAESTKSVSVRISV